MLTAAGVVGAGPAAAAPEAPDLSGYSAAAPDQYVDGGEVYFQTPDGLLCGIRPAQGMAGCDGPLPRGSSGANQVVLSADQVRRGLHNTASPLFVKSTGAAAAVLPVGHKIVFDDFACAVGDAKVFCTKGTPVAQWMAITPDGASVGPPTPGLPAGFPDPNDFVVGDESYIVGTGAKNLFPVFTVGSGLTCKMAMFSGGVIGCDTTPPAALPGVDPISMLIENVDQRSRDYSEIAQAFRPGHAEMDLLSQQIGKVYFVVFREQLELERKQLRDALLAGIRLQQKLVRPQRRLKEKKTVLLHILV